MKKLFAIVISAMLLLLCLAVSAGAADYVYYENDFSDANTLSDFTQYRGEWGIVDGKLMLTGLGDIEMDKQAWLLYTADPGVVNLTDYILDVDIYGLSTQGGPIFRSDLGNLYPESNNGFCGYQAFVGFAGNVFAIGHSDPLGNWAGNLAASESGVTSMGANVHMQITVSGNNISILVTDIDSGAELWNHSFEDGDFAYGTFGFRAVIMKDGIMNLGVVGYDNIKVTATGKVGDHLAAGKALSDFVPGVVSEASLFEVTPAVEVVVPEVVEVNASELDMTATEYVFYENDFSDASTIADFTQYRGRWAVKDGVLYYNELSKGYENSGNLSFILYSGNHDANLLTNYSFELDVINSQSASGPISHADLSLADSEGGNSFYGYLAYISSAGTIPCLGYGNADGGWGGIISNGEETLAPGGNYHIKVVRDNENYSVYFSAVGSDEIIWSYEGVDVKWEKGTFGIRSISSKDLLVNLGNTGYDNMKVTVYGDEAVLLNAGYHPNAVIVSDVAAETTAAPEETGDADATVDPEETTADPEATAEPEATVDADVTEEAPETTTAPVGTDAPAEEGGAPVGLIVGIIAAVVVIAVVVVIVLKKKKK